MKDVKNPIPALLKKRSEEKEKHDAESLERLKAARARFFERIKKPKQPSDQ